MQEGGGPTIQGREGGKLQVGGGGKSYTWGGLQEEGGGSYDEGQGGAGGGAGGAATVRRREPARRRTNKHETSTRRNKTFHVTQHIVDTGPPRKKTMAPRSTPNLPFSPDHGGFLFR